MSHRAAIGQTEHVANLRRLDAAASTVRDRLVEDREPVARRSFRGARDQRQRLGLDGDAFRLCNLCEMAGEEVGGDAAKIEALTA